MKASRNDYPFHSEVLESLDFTDIEASLPTIRESHLAEAEKPMDFSSGYSRFSPLAFN